MKRAALFVFACLALIGCGGGGSEAGQRLLAGLYTGEIALAECGADPCGLQLELAENLGAVSGTVSIVDVNNRMVYRGNFLGTVSGSEFSGAATLSLGPFHLDAAILSNEVSGTWTLGTGAAQRTGPLQAADVTGQRIDLRGDWTGIVEFSENFDLFDAGAKLDTVSGDVASGTAFWVGHDGEHTLPIQIMGVLGTTLRRDPVTGFLYASRVEPQGATTVLWLVVIAPDGQWVSLFLRR